MHPISNWQPKHRKKLSKIKSALWWHENNAKVKNLGDQLDIAEKANSATDVLISGISAVYPWNTSWRIKAAFFFDKQSWLMKQCLFQSVGKTSQEAF